MRIIYHINIIVPQEEDTYLYGQFGQIVTAFLVSWLRRLFYKL